MTDTSPAPASSPSQHAVPGRGLAVAALVVGVVALVCAFLGWVAVAIGIVAVVLGIVALRKGQSKGMSITGIVTGGLGTIAGAIVAVVFALMIGAVVSTVEAIENADVDAIVEELDEALDGEVADMREDNLFASDPAVDEALAALSARMDAAAPEIAGVGLSFYGEVVNVSVVVESERDTPSVPASALKGILDEIVAFDAPADIVEWQLDGWDLDGWTIDLIEPATEIGVRADLVDQEWNRITIPAASASAIF